ncbi:MAG: tRNA lysidine(34) synthetase TilS [bacterium]|nr:tRNA lysidine(34) synthetase TilS [bacterium]
MNIPKNINQYYNINKKEAIVVGVSSGPDSMALLHYLQNNISNTLICCHINHNKRKESVKEENYLKQYCKKHNIIFETTTITSYTKDNFQNQARNKRYKFYQETLNKYKSTSLFLAHHSDDLMETIIIKILRGSNIQGYAGFKEITNMYNKYNIYRPFINITKEDIIKYNKKHNITYFNDNSNNEDIYIRNKIRHNIITLLKEENKNIHKKFIQFSNLLIEYDQYITKEVENIIPSVYINNKLDLKEFNKLPKLIQTNILYYILYSHFQNISFNQKHINNIFSIINNNKPNLVINLPNKIIIKKEYNNLIITQNTKKNLNNSYKIEFKNNIKINNHYIEKIKEIDKNDNSICKLNSNNIKLPLYIRNKNSKDYIELRNTNGKSKIKNIFIDSKVPLEKRDNYPLLVDATDKILWIPKLKKSKFCSKNNEFYDIILKYCEKEEI